MSSRALIALAALALCSGCSSAGGGTASETDTSIVEDTDEASAPADDSGGEEDASVVDSSRSDSSRPDTSAADSRADAPETPTTTCTPDAKETEACGKCGTRARFCGLAGEWLAWGACTGEKACAPTESRVVDCGKCGKRTETCGSSCDWTPGACTGEGVCTPGDVDNMTTGCSNPTYIKTRTCTSTCAWSDWGTCLPPKGWVNIAAAPIGVRYAHTAVWTGTEMVIWGGYGGLGDGAAYNPSTDTWRMLPAVTGTIPKFVGRWAHTAIWTGSKMIVWGGRPWSSLDGPYRRDGAEYDPATDSWTALPDAPIEARMSHTAVWTGTEMIIFGGRGASILSSGDLADGGAYNPTTKTWRAIPLSPRNRYGHQAVWTGTQMIVLGGASCVGGYCTVADAYSPTTNAWTALSPSVAARGDHSGLPAGGSSNPLAVFWGGHNGTGGLNTGDMFDSATGTWKAMTVPTDTVFPSSKRWYVSAWSTGSVLFYWGGAADAPGGTRSDGASYDVATDTWTAMSNINALSARYFASAVWTGTEAVIWGGYKGGALGDGKIYRP